MTQTNIGKLGERLDGWADLVDGAGDRAEQAWNHFGQVMHARQMPDVKVDRRTMTTGGLTGNKRPYHINFHRAGATVAVYIGAAGQDLYVSWTAFVKPVWRWLTILIILGVSMILAFLTNLVVQGAVGIPPEYYFRYLDRVAVALVPGCCAGTIAYTIIISILTLIAGKVLKNSALAFFIHQIDEFVADDITAMMLAVHHSLLQSMDMASIDKSLLRAKEQFHAGRRERLI